MRVTIPKESKTKIEDIMAEVAKGTPRKELKEKFPDCIFDFRAD